MKNKSFDVIIIGGGVRNKFWKIIVKKMLLCNLKWSL